MLVPLLLAAGLAPQEAPAAPTTDDLKVAARVVGLTFSDEEAELMLAGVRENLRSYERLWGLELGQLGRAGALAVGHAAGHGRAPAAAPRARARAARAA